MRHYEPIWNALKSQGHNGSVTISASPKLFRRIIKAVSKEKGLDIVHKVSIAPEISVLVSERCTLNGNPAIKFTLKYTIIPSGRSARTVISTNMKDLGYE